MATVSKEDIVIYDRPEKGEAIYDSIVNMLNVSRTTNKYCQSSFDGVNTSVSSSLTVNESIAYWESAMTKAGKNYSETAEYKELKQRQEEENKKEQEVLNAIKEEKLSLKIAPFELTEDWNRYGSPREVLDFVYRWGKLMQVEMKNQGAAEPTSNIIETTQSRANTQHLSAPLIKDSSDLLIGAWTHGEELDKYFHEKENKKDSGELTQHVAEQVKSR